MNLAHGVGSVYESPLPVWLYVVGAAATVIDNDIATLLDTRARLLKSRSLAQRAHQLQQRTNPTERDTRYRTLGLALMIFSAVALVGLLASYFWLI